MLAIMLAACGGRTMLESDGGAGGGSGSGGSSGGTMPAGTYCDITASGVHVCLAYSNVSGNLGLDSACQQQGGAVVSACPGTGELGCCVFAQAGFTVSACYYCPGDPAVYQRACAAGGNATWMAPSGGPAPCGG